MSRGQTTIVIFLAALVAVGVTWRACADDDVPRSATPASGDAGSSRTHPSVAPRSRRASVVAPVADHARRITFHATDGAGQPLAVAATITIHDGALVVAPATLAIAGATALEIGDGELHDVAVVVVAADVAARAWPVTDASALLAAPAAGAAGAVTGVISIDGARASDVTVELVQLGTFGPGHPVTHARPLEAARDVRAPARRFLGTAGVVRIDDLQPGGYLAIIHAPGRGAALMSVAVSPEHPADVSAALPPAASIGGTVKDHTDAPLAGAVIRLRVDGQVVRATVSDARGVWLLDSVPVTGPGELEVDAPACAGDVVPVTLSVGRTTRVLVARCE